MSATKNTTEYTVKAFRELTAMELYTFLRLRAQVFVVEQNCLHQDLDNKDLFCHHLMLYEAKQLIAYARLMPPGVSYEEMSIGRVVTSPDVRGKGAGKKLMALAIENCRKIFGDGPIRIGAQYYLEKFYTEMGFKPTGDVYDEDGIAHIHMVKFQ